MPWHLGWSGDQLGIMIYIFCMTMFLLAEVFEVSEVSVVSFDPPLALSPRLRFSQDFEMTEPSPVAEYAAPDMRPLAQWLSSNKNVRNGAVLQRAAMTCLRT